MRASNIDIDSLIDKLNQIKQEGTNFGITSVDIEVTEEKGVNKIVLYPIIFTDDEEDEEYESLEGISEYDTIEGEKPVEIVIKNPNISTDNNDIFKTFNDIV